jgi:benzoylformate decarboxylase
VLALHEASVVGIATGWAIAREEPALALLHTTAGLGNAVGALATARVNRAPLVVLVGQQDRRHLAHEPFLAGRSNRSRATIPSGSTNRFGRKTSRVDRPGLPRGHHGQRSGDGHRADGRLGRAGRRRSERGRPGFGRAGGRSRPAAIEALVELARLGGAAGDRGGLGRDDAATWASLVRVAEKLGAPVWQESFGAATRRSKTCSRCERAD